MAPKKGQRGYATFLKEQRSKRQKKAAATKKTKARDLLKSELRAKDAQLDAATRRANIHTRGKAAAEGRFREERAKHNALVEQKKSKTQVRLEASLAHMTQKWAEAAREVTDWEVWYNNVKTRAPKGFLRELHRLGKPLPRARDGRWGGGQ